MPRDVCPRCGTESEYLGIHWAKSADCEYPTPDAHQQAVLAGCLLAGGTIKNRDSDDTPYYEIATGDRATAEWIGGELDWLFAAVDELAGREEYGGASWGVRTRSLPWYRGVVADWYDGDKRTTPVTLEPSPALLRTVYALRGGVGFALGVWAGILVNVGATEAHRRHRRGDSTHV